MNRTGVFVAAALLAGCSSEKRTNYALVGLVEVSGKVTLDGEPLASAQVAFENPETKTFSVGKTDAAGAYKLMFNSEKSGCTPGKKVVRITVYRGGESDAEPEAVPSDTKIPARYGRNSELSAEVDSGHRTFDFALTSK